MAVAKGSHSRDTVSVPEAKGSLWGIKVSNCKSPHERSFMSQNSRVGAEAGVAAFSATTGAKTSQVPG